VLEQVGDTACLAGFMDRADADGDIGGHGRRVVAFHQQQAQAVGQAVFDDLVGQRRGRGKAGSSRINSNSSKKRLQVIRSTP